jgi:DNA-binding protein HU-beta
MIKVDIINDVAKAADITKVRAEVAVEALLEAMKDSLMKGERIELRGFGVFQVKPRKRGIGRNPRTGREVRIPPGRTIRFKPGKDLQSLALQAPDGDSFPASVGPSRLRRATAGRWDCPLGAGPGPIPAAALGVAAWGRAPSLRRHRMLRLPRRCAAPGPPPRAGRRPRPRRP